MNRKKIGILFIVVLSIFGAVVGNTAAEEPVLGPVNITPQNPTVLSDITITAKMSAEDMQEVHLIIKECDASICKIERNLTMNEKSQGTYEVTYTLSYDKATYFTYYFAINSADSWTKTNPVDVPLLPLPNGSTNGANDNGGNQSPGFELIVVIVAVGTLLILFGKKRYK